ncbi:type II toxin-antitoxin system RelB/DinJ family antitoxin [Streptococcus sp. NLN64]|uniref:type II toxin-antitoxin system RelB/DinJ family antitoxin n=1 Tax=Streptococcus sp. NLN64 TaxID=2822799 RepID=UPI0018C94BA9|nr:type II toxin-antitoxin system RelB/DinJ family antitoxin [Streptococcus sp. NLN64]MBG9368206.1 type II toxin-antitoxin system RelB/DinJ family antitoxin [Streptococcus sp. NLN64]
MTTITIRIDESLKKESSEIFDQLGMDMTTAIRIFFKQSVMNRGLPFELELAPQLNDAEFYHLAKSVSPVVKVDANNPKSVNQYFGDENEYPEFEDYFND